jgi:hypothetical protein
MRGKTLLIVRRLHLYLSVFFAPLLLVFVVTGWAQTMNFDRSNPFLNRLSEVHTSQLYPTEPQHKNQNGSWEGDWEGRHMRISNLPMKELIALMSIALLVSISLGLALAFTMVRNRVPVWIALILGVATPVFLLTLAHFR